MLRRYIRSLSTGAFGVGLLCLATLSCSSEPEHPDAISSSGDLIKGFEAFGGASSLGEARPRTYPSGPYGEANPKVGERIEDLTFDGFTHPKPGQQANKSDLGSITLNEIRRSDNRYLIVHVSAYWCPPCLLAAHDLETNRSIIEAAGATVVELLVDGRSSETDPKQDELEAWTKSASLTWPTVTPGDERTRLVFPDREHIYLVDLDTMQIVWRAYGFSNDITVGQRLVNALSESLSGAASADPK